MITRREHTSSYTVIDNGALEDNRLSFAARGLLAYLLSRHHDATVNIDKIAQAQNTPRDPLRRAAGELERLGYIVRRREERQQANGRLRQQIVVDVIERPYRDADACPVSGTRLPGRETGRAQVLSTKDRKNLSTKIKIKSKDQNNVTPSVSRLPARKETILKPDRNNLQLADWFLDHCLRTAHTDYGAPRTGACNRQMLAANIKRIRNTYGLTSAEIEQMMINYIQVPSLWNQRIHPANDLVSANTVVRLRNTSTVEDVAAPVTTMTPATSGLAARRFQVQPLEETA